MIAFLAQTAFLLALAFVLGCSLGALAYRSFGEGFDGTIPMLSWRGPSPSLEGPPPRARLGMRPRAARKASPQKGERAKREQAREEPAGEAPAPDDLKKIRGIGRQIEIRLHNLGIHSFAQIAAWNAADRKEWGGKLAFPGRIEREDWVGQAKKLARGKETRFSRRVARGEVPSSEG